jgi:hypothetical protein
VWRLPEADDRLDVSPGDPDYTIKHRPVFRANAPGEPITPSLAGRVAAVFALAAQRTADSDPDQAREWLEKAAAVYDRADTDPDPDKPLVTAFPSGFYPEDSWQDDLEFAGAELALAARELGDYREGDWTADAARWARAYLDSDVKGTLNVADVSALAHVDLSTALDGDRSNGVGAEDLYKDLRRQLIRSAPARSTTTSTPYRTRSVLWPPPASTPRRPGTRASPPSPGGSGAGRSAPTRGAPAS